MLVKWPLTSVTETCFRKDCVFYKKTEGIAFELMWQSLRHIYSWLSASDVIPAAGMKREKQHQVQIGPRKFLTQNGWDITHQTLGRQQCPGSLTTSSLKLVLPHHRKQWRPNCPFHPGYKQLPCSAQSLCNTLSCLVEAERLLHWDREISSLRHREIFCWKCFNVQVVTKGRPYVWVVCLWTSSSLPCCTQRCLHLGLVLSREWTTLSLFQVAFRDTWACVWAPALQTLHRCEHVL